MQKATPWTTLSSSWVFHIAAFVCFFIKRSRITRPNCAKMVLAVPCKICLDLHGFACFIWRRSSTQEASV